MVKKILKEKKSYLLLVLILSYFLIFYRLGKNFLVSFDEAWYAEISRWMLKSNNFLKMTWNNQPFFDKPPLFFWLQALSFNIFGLTEFAARFFPALSGLLVVYLTFLIGQKFSLYTGLFSSFILLSFPLFINQARFANLEMLLTFFITLAIFYLLDALKKPGRINLFFLATALAIFTKGVIGFIPFLVLLPLVLSRTSSFPKKAYLQGILLVFLVNLPWFLAINLLFGHGKLILPGFTLLRLKQINPATGIDFFYYLKILKTGTKLWFLLLPFALFFTLRERSLKLKVILSWFFITYLVFSVPYLKNSWYITSIYPSIALILGFFISQVFKQKFFLLKLLFILTIFLTHFLLYQDQFWVPETVSHEVALLKIVREQSSGLDLLYLDDNYHPLAVFYSQRKVVPLRFNRASVNTLNPQTLKLDKKTFFLTNEETIGELKEDLTAYQLSTQIQLGDKILLSVQP